MFKSNNCNFLFLQCVFTIYQKYECKIKSNKLIINVLYLKHLLFYFKFWSWFATSLSSIKRRCCFLYRWKRLQILTHYIVHKTVQTMRSKITGIQNYIILNPQRLVFRKMNNMKTRTTQSGEFNPMEYKVVTFKKLCKCNQHMYQHFNQLVD